MLTDAQVYCMTSMIYLFRPPLTAKSIGKRRKQSYTPNIYLYIIYIKQYVKILTIIIVCNYMSVIFDHIFYILICRFFTLFLLHFIFLLFMIIYFLLIFCSLLHLITQSINEL